MMDVKTTYRQISCNVGTKIVKADEFEEADYPFIELRPTTKKLIYHCGQLLLR